MFYKLVYHEHVLFLKTEKIKKAFRDSFASSYEQINFCRQLFDSISTFNKPLETRGYNRYLDPKYKKMLGTKSRFTQRALDLKSLNDEIRIKNNFPVLTFKELHLLSLHYNVSHGDSLYMQEFMFILIRSREMFRFFETVVLFFSSFYIRRSKFMGPVQSALSLGLSLTKQSIFQNLTTTEKTSYNLWTNSIQQRDLAIDANPSANYDSNISEPFSDNPEPPNAEMWQDLAQDSPASNPKARKKAQGGNKIKQMMNFSDESQVHEMDHRRVGTQNVSSLKMVQSKIASKPKHRFARPDTDVFIDGDEEDDEVEELPEVQPKPKGKMHASMDESIDLLDQGVKNKLDKFKF